MILEKLLKLLGDNKHDWGGDPKRTYKLNWGMMSINIVKHPIELNDVLDIKEDSDIDYDKTTKNPSLLKMVTGKIH